MMKFSQFSIFLVFFICILIGVASSENVLQLELDEPMGLYEEAKIGIGESPEKKESSLKELRALLNDHKQLKVPVDDDNFLLKFLRFSKFNVKKAFDRVKYFYNYEAKYKTVLKNLTTDAVKRVYEDNVFQVLPNRDKHGRKVALFRIGRWDPSRIPRDDLFRGLYAAVQIILQEPATQISGIAGIADFDGFSYSQLFAISPSFVGMVLDWLQNSVPMTIGEIHILNNPFIFNILWTIMGPFMDDEFRDKISIDNSNYEKMINNLGPDTLQKKYGGTMENIDFGKPLATLIDQYKGYLEESQKFGLQ